MAADCLLPMRRLRRALMLRHAGVLFLRGVGLLCLAAVMAVVADAVCILPDDVRALVPAGIAVLAGMAGLLLIRRMVLSSLFRAAVTLEREGILPALSASMAIELARQVMPDDAARFLRDTAVTRGMDRTRGVSAWSVLRVPLWRSARFAVAMALLPVAGAVLFPEICAAVYPRYADPRGDHPPYSSLRLCISATPDTVTYGDGCRIDARVSGGAPGRLYLAMQDGDSVQHGAMFIRPDGSYTQTLANLRTPVTCWVTDGRARSRRCIIAIRYTPRIEAVAVTQTFPAYTHLPPKSVQALTRTEFSIPEGTALAFCVSSNRPLSGGEMTITPTTDQAQTVIPLRPVPGLPGTLSADWTPAGNAVFELTVRDVDGTAATDPARGRVDVMPDRRPHVAVLEPGRHALATPDATIPVKVLAEDDYGVATLLHFRGLNGSPEHEVSLPPVPAAGSPRITADTAFCLSDLGVKPGDRISYFLEAVDTYPAGPHVAASRLYSLEIISSEQYRAIMRRRLLQRQFFERELAVSAEMRRIAESARAMKKAMDAAGAGERERPAFRKSMRERLGALGDDAKKCRARIERLCAEPEWFDIDASFRNSFRETIRRLQAAEDQARGAGGEEGVPVVEAVDELVDTLCGAATEVETDVEEPAMRLREVVLLLAEAQKFAAITARQRELARLTVRYLGATPSDARLFDMECAEFATSEEVIARQLEEIRLRIPELLAAIPEEEAYRDLRASSEAFLKAIQELNIAGFVTAAKTAFAATDAREGHIQATEAGERMMRLVALTPPMQQGGSSCLRFVPILSSGLGATVDQMLSALQGNSGQQNGYSLAGDDMALYGTEAIDMPAVAGNGQEEASAQGGADSARVEALHPETESAASRPGQAAVQIQEGVRYPLRYRKLVGEYFRAVMDEEEGRHHE